MLELKEYQQIALDRLREYLRDIPALGLTDAFKKQARRQAAPGALVVYCDPPDMPEVPYVCLRVPTGGGKTLMAAHAVGLVNRELLRSDHSVVLWLAPTKTIVAQTLKALRDRDHPYRQALGAGVDGPVTILDLQEAQYVTRATLDSSTCVLVGTLAAPRARDPEGRKIYDSNGNLMSHFQTVAPELVPVLEADDDGVVPYSLANVLRLRRPVVILDEAHNASTSLALETLGRFSPSCILEFTATPVTVDDRAHGKYASNVLYRASAWQLKDEGMVKLPIRLETQAQWQEVLKEAVWRRRDLEERARAEEERTGEYLRPILLIQAQPRNKQRETLSVEVIKQRLLDDERIPAEQIAVATGEERGLDGIDLFSRDCPIRIILTQQALKEGWDCSFAYVLCSVAELGAATPVEQILGRIMRLPRATKKQDPDLNAAYAYVASSRFAEAADRLREGLVNSGYTRLEAQKLVPEQPNLFKPQTERSPSPSERGAVFQLPRLAVKIDGQAHLWDEWTFLPDHWDLSGCPARLEETEFSLEATGRVFEIDARPDSEDLRISPLEEVQRQILLVTQEATMSREQLTDWLDRNLRRRQVTQAQLEPFLRELLRFLTEVRGLSEADLTRARFRLREAIDHKILAYLLTAKRETLTQVAQGQLPADFGEPVVADDEENVFTFKPDYYPVEGEEYERSYEFTMHFYARLGKFDSHEEEMLAWELDGLPQVRHWVRNLVGQARSAFSLPIPRGHFYPDFLAELTDGRCVALEYKGEHLFSNDESKEKEIMGHEWEARSRGRCLYRQVRVGDLGRLEQVLGL